MKLFAVLLGAIALLAGLTGGLRAYSVSATTPPGPRLAVVPHQPVAQAVRPGVTFRWAPCRKPAVRRGKTCVTVVTRTVTLPPPVVTAPAAPAAAPQALPARVAHSSAPHAEPGEHGGHEHEGEHEGEHDEGGGGDD
jgi:hypothetical protein